MAEHDALRALKRRVPCAALAAHLGLCRDRVKAWLFECPCCGQLAARQRPDADGYRCARGECGHSGDQVTMIREVKRLGFTDAVMVLTEIDAAMTRKRQGKDQPNLFGH